MAPRSTSTAGTLARCGFLDLPKAATLLADRALAPLAEAGGGEVPDDLLGALGETADPDLALLGLVRLLESLASRPEDGSTGLARLVSELTTEGPGRERLLAVLGGSSALVDHLVRHPEHWLDAARAERHTAEQVRAQVLEAVGAGRGDRTPLDALRVAYRQGLLRIAARDLTAPDPLAEMPSIGEALAELAEAALEGGLAIAREDYGPGHEQCRLAVIGMGKTGGGELNYVSDVDVIFVAEPAEGADEDVALRIGTTLATGLMRACSAPTAEGTLWPVDAALRPEGKQGPLVRTIRSHRAYYERWAKTWEFQALLKAWVSAGDKEVGLRYKAEISPLVWGAAGRENFVEDVQAMRRRVEQHVPANEAARQLKLGPGGLRDVEFSVQLLQLVHGRTDPHLRSATTLEALAALAKGGYVGRDDAAILDEAYRRLRCIEHRVQLFRLRRTHLMPDNPADLRRLGRAMGHRTDPEHAVVADRQATAREVRRIHERLFYRPLLAAVAKLAPTEAGLTPEAARERLAALGFRDPAGALRHISALTSGVSRRAAIQRTLLPVMLGWFADEADPDAGLLSFRRVSDELGTTHWYLKMLRDEGRAADWLAHCLARSRLAADLLVRSPESVAVFGEVGGLVPRTREALVTVMRAAAGRRQSPGAAAAAVRSIRRHELLRIVAADLVGAVDLPQVGAALTDLTAATLEVVLEVAVDAVEAREGAPLGGDVLIVAMGSFGGGEPGYASDADVMFVHRPHPGSAEEQVQQQATLVVQELKKLLAGAGPEPQLTVDADLRPEGKNGPLVRSLASYRTYYERWALTWEFQALLRATPVAGPEDLAEEFLRLIAPLRWPAAGLTAAQRRDIRTLKARMESERLPRGGDPGTHLKLGRGGLTDVEWTAQLLQMCHAHDVPALQVTGTLQTLGALEDARLLTAEDAHALREAWLLAAGLRNAGVLWRGRAVDAVPSDVRDADGMGRILGRGPAEAAQLTELWRRVGRRARHAMNFNFYDSPRGSSV
ncbi:MAG TPA: bifunctional [glutamine synthetase] adenylyltransferase/[glutamine synthetase]-adenylyl-L-tyrosine phosphorylase [Intrasporangium sp.]|uniref:bifunctional [glutamine synthetase] adenylyltransferase/[glutamine synthetase]-adenylyl-L-tyrosine phosphorylase n=1 Tax=Intrasporangium sp. TaxID=1925024 RepID=UPI002D77C593|nr:bifunctional [glutamine synthetase] adenylyltransferase/[glutamine synthetase]-adenylyl-L-tyrosine phosphorylase [Intrasporangium sp.]HET7397067.1 bifunctional [glutamine synthetase] adenylyltransferase/[glutamine synthetase]-adenylyl-L-tyrosine phosphorylase [Intrasporangium sp.]